MLKIRAYTVFLLPIDLTIDRPPLMKRPHSDLLLHAVSV